MISTDEYLYAHQLKDYWVFLAYMRKIRSRALPGLCGCSIGPIEYDFIKGLGIFLGTKKLNCHSKY